MLQIARWEVQDATLRCNYDKRHMKKNQATATKGELKECDRNNNKKR
jgi:hypothetical protein